MNGLLAWLMAQRRAAKYQGAVMAEFRIERTATPTSSDAKVAVAHLLGQPAIAWRSNPL